MADELVLFTNPQSRGATTHWMLEEIGCPYRIEVKQFGPDMKSPEYLAINPMGKVPTIKHGNTVVTETGAILCYLADAFPEAKLAPPLGAARRLLSLAVLRRRLLRCRAISNKATGWNPPAGGLSGASATARTNAPWTRWPRRSTASAIIAADHFTAADLYVASFLHFGMMFGDHRKAAGLRGLRRALQRPAAMRGRGAGQQADGQVG